MAELLDVTREWDPNSIIPGEHYSLSRKYGAKKEAVAFTSPFFAKSDGKWLPYPTLPIADYGELHEMMEIATCGFPLGEVLQDQLGTVTSSFTRGMISSIIPAQGVDVKHLGGFQLDLTATNGNSGGPVFSLHTGEVFGVLQGGAVHPQTGHAVQGLTKAEPIYPALKSDFLDGLMKD